MSLIICPSQCNTQLKNILNLQLLYVSIFHEQLVLPNVYNISTASLCRPQALIIPACAHTKQSTFRTVVHNKVTQC